MKITFQTVALSVALTLAASAMFATPASAKNMRHHMTRHHMTRHHMMRHHMMHHSMMHHSMMHHSMMHHSMMHHSMMHHSTMGSMGTMHHGNAMGKGSMNGGAVGAPTDTANPATSTAPATSGGDKM